jgi:hypothetical protein
MPEEAAFCYMFCEKCGLSHLKKVTKFVTWLSSCFL